MPALPGWLWWLPAVLIAGYALHRLGLWLESRGWLYYTRRSRKTRASLAIAAIVDPYAQRVLEAQEQEVEEAAEPGDPPSPLTQKRRDL